MTEQSTVLLVSEVARILRISEHKVREMTRTRELPSFKIGTSIRIRRDALDKWMVDREAPPVQDVPYMTFPAAVRCRR